MWHDLGGIARVGHGLARGPFMAGSWVGFADRMFDKPGCPILTELFDARGGKWFREAVQTAAANHPWEALCKKLGGRVVFRKGRPGAAFS